MRKITHPALVLALAMSFSFAALIPRSGGELLPLSKDSKVLADSVKKDSLN